MIASQIKVGGRYTAKVSGKIVVVVVDEIKETSRYSRGRRATAYHVTNTVTGKKLKFASAARFRDYEDGASRRRVAASIQPALVLVEPKEPVVVDKPLCEMLASKTMVVPEVDPLNDARERQRTSGFLGGLASQIARSGVVSADKAPHVVVQARAGTGKSFTIIEGVKRLYGMGDPSIVPSQQQQAVWDAIMLGGRPRSSCLVAFNVSIANELRNRIPTGVNCSAKTMHGLGYYAVRKAFSLVKDPDDGRVPEITAELLATDLRRLRKDKNVLVKAVKELTGLCKMNLVESEEEIMHLVSHYDVEVGDYRKEILQLVPAVLERCKDVARDGYIDFADMVWLPSALGLKVWKNDLLLIDERQDLNLCQMKLALMAGDRIVAVGDDRQAIYQFCGAHQEACQVFERMLADTGREVVHLPLTVTRRCGRAIVEEAKRIVPDFEAHESNPEGVVSRAKYPIQKQRLPGGGWQSYELPIDKTYLPLVQDGDMILCRSNAPLVREFFRLLRMGKKAAIQGRNVAASLLTLLDRVDAPTIPECLQRLNDWLQKESDKENAERNPSEDRLQALSDKHGCLKIFVEEAESDDPRDPEWSIDRVKERISAIFTDNKDAPGVKLSSVHRAKGLESRRVFFITGFGRSPESMQDWEIRAGDNLQYVAITRAIDELVYVS